MIHHTPAPRSYISKIIHLAQAPSSRSPLLIQTQEDVLRGEERDDKRCGDSAKTTTFSVIFWAEAPPLWREKGEPSPRVLAQKARRDSGHQLRVYRHVKLLRRVV